MADCQIDIAIRHGGLTRPGRPWARAAGARHEDVSWGMPANTGRQAFIVAALVLAGVPLSSLRHIFITHHSDHNADYGI